MPFLAPARQKCLGVDRLDLLRRSLMVEGHQRVMRLGGGAAQRVTPAEDCPVEFASRGCVPTMTPGLCYLYL